MLINRFEILPSLELLQGFNYRFKLVLMFQIHLGATSLHLPLKFH